jgi:putative flippase GtrA
MPPFAPLLRQIFRYGAVGVGQIGLDSLTFIGLTFIGTPPGPANIAGRVLGACAGFWLNGKWTFANQGTAGLSRKSLLRFLASWLLTTTLSTLIVSLVDQSHGLHWAWLVKPVADGMLAALGFAISKFWIYR